MSRNMFLIILPLVFLLALVLVNFSAIGANKSETGKMTEADANKKELPDMQKATFAAGCFWGVEDAFRHVDGVVETTVGYTGGHTKNPTYKEVCSGKTGHAEAVEVIYDPLKVAYENLLNVFWSIHDPTQKNRQGPDIGEQYRSAIFYHNDAQKQAALESKMKLEKSGEYNSPIATEITAAGDFYRAEEYHQRYYEKTGLSTCRIKSN
jgi:peptide-methionine (S)-S-oxide reductase